MQNGVAGFPVAPFWFLSFWLFSMASAKGIVAFTAIARLPATNGRCGARR